MPDINQDLLQRFYEDSAMREEVKKYLEAHLDNLALEKVYAKEDTHGIADALEAIESAFKQMDEAFEKPPPKKDIINEAR